MISWVRTLAAREEKEVIPPETPAQPEQTGQALTITTNKPLRQQNTATYKHKDYIE
jgi:hypothetical protein